MRNNKRAMVSVVAVAAALAAALHSVPARAQAAPLLFDPHGSDSHPACAAPGEPQVVPLTAADGTSLTTLVYRPVDCDDPSWKTPVLLADSDYFESTPYGAERDLAQFLVDHYTPQGYTVVKLESRGSGRSGGCHDDFGPASASDFKQVVEHFAEQPWTNGRVGSWGGSADGNYQNEGAVLAPRGLVTTVVMNAVSSEYDEHAFDGVPYDDAGGNGSAEYEYQAAGSNAGPPEGHIHEVTDRSACRAGRQTSSLQPYMDGSESSYYADRDYRRHVGDLKATVLYVASFHDQSVWPIAVDGWYDQIPTFKRAVLTQLDHEPVFDTKTSATNQAMVSIMRTDWWAMFDAWFDYWLLSQPTGVADWPAVQVQDDHNVWRAVSSFAGLGSDQSQPLGSGVLGQPAGDGAVEQFSEVKSLTWDRPVTSSVHLSGQARLVAPISIDRANAHFMVTLQEVIPGGAVRTLTRGYLAADHRDSLTSTQPVGPGYFSYRVRTMPFDAWVGAGSTLRLILAGTDPVPLVDEAPTGGAWTALPAGTGFTATIPVDGRSILTLPIADDTCGLEIGPGWSGQETPPAAAVPGCPAPPVPPDATG